MINKIKKGYKPWNKGKKINRDEYPNYGHRNKHLSKKHKTKIGEANKGHPNYNIGFKGCFKKGHKVLKKWREKFRNPRSEVTKRKIREARAKQIITEFHKKKISLSMQGKNIGKNNGMYGKTGELSPRWLGGKSFEPYNKYFNNKFKRAIRKRDNYICMLCGIHNEKLKRSLSVHHMNYDKKLSIPQNCISLCRKCHSLTNENRKYWTKFFQDLLAKNYDYQYSETGEVILNLGVKNGK